MSTFRHTFDGVAVDEPLDWSGFNADIDRDYDKRTISAKFPTSAKFGGGGYDTIRTLFLSGFCSIIEYKVEEKCGGAWWVVMRSNIIIGDSVFNLTKCEVDVSLVDDGIGARIENNRKLPIRFTTERTKNADTMTAVSERTVYIFDPNDPLGTYLDDPRRMIDWYDAIRHAVGYITDLTVPVQSDWYEALTADEGWAITTGLQLRTFGSSDRDLYMEYTFDDLFTEIAKKFNLWMFITRAADGSPVLRIEQDADTYSDTEVSSMPSQEDLTQEVDTELLFASVAVGSENELPNLDAVQSLPFLVLIGQSKERFGFEGVCNTNTELDLVNKWNIGTNLIEAVIGGNTDYDDEIFLIQYNGADAFDEGFDSGFGGTLKAVKGDDYNPLAPPYQYNPLMLNFRVISRYNMANDIAVSIGDPTNLEGSVEQVLTLPLPQGNFPVAGAGTTLTYYTPAAVIDFSGVISDPGANFQLSPGRYTVPAQGFYSFTFNYRFQVVSFSTVPPVLQSFIRFEAFDVGNTSIGVQEVNSHSPPIFLGLNGGSFETNAQATANFVLNPTDYMTVRFGWRVTGLVAASQLVTVSVMPGGWIFAADGTPGGGSVVYDTELAKIIKYSWERHIPAQEWAELMADPRLSIGISSTPVNLRTTWPLSLSRKMGTGEASLETITDRTQPL